MRRREFITLPGGAAVLPLEAARAVATTPSRAAAAPPFVTSTHVGTYDFLRDPTINFQLNRWVSLGGEYGPTGLTTGSFVPDQLLAQAFECSDGLLPHAAVQARSLNFQPASISRSFEPVTCQLHRLSVRLCLLVVDIACR